MDLKYTYGEKRNNLNVANWSGKRKRNVIASSATSTQTAESALTFPLGYMGGNKN